MAPPRITPPPQKIFSDFVTLGHSLSGSYGAKTTEKGWPYRLASLLGADLIDSHFDGAVAAYDDTTSTGDGGWATSAVTLDPKNTIGPYIAANSLVSIYFGQNDMVVGWLEARTVAPMKAAMRGMIGHARCATRYADNDATVTKTGAAGVGVGSWGSSVTTTADSIGGRAATTTGATDELHIAVPSDFPGGAIWIFTLTGPGQQTTVPGAITAGTASLTVADASLFGTSGSGRIIDNGVPDLFTWTSKAGNVLSGIPTTGANALLAHATTGLPVATDNLEGGSFTVDVDGTPVSPPAGVTFDTRGLGIPASPGRRNGHGWRIPIATAGAHTVNLKLTALEGGATKTFYFNGWGVEAVVPPCILLPQAQRPQNWNYYAPINVPPDDTTIATIRTAISDLAAEFDQYVFIGDADGALNKTKRYFYQPLGSTTTATVTAGATTLAVADTTRFSPFASSGYVTDAGVDDVLTYTGKSTTTGPGNLTGIPASGTYALTAHASSGLVVAPADSVHMSDEGHELFAAKMYEAIIREAPRDARSLVASQRKRGTWETRDSWKYPVSVATTSNVVITNPATSIDGIPMGRGDRVLLAGQTDPTENGIWKYVKPGTLGRDLDADGNFKLLPGACVKVQQGTLYKKTEWTLVSPLPFAPGTSAQYWTQTYPSPSIVYRAGWDTNDGARFHVASTIRVSECTNNAIAALVSGRLTLVGGITVPAGETITAISFVSGATAATTPTNQWFCLVSGTPAIIRSTANDTTTAWAANTMKTKLLTSTWTPTVDTAVWIGIMVAATTVPSLSGSVAEVAGVAGKGTVRVGSSTATLTTAPADGTAVLTPTLIAGIGRPYALIT